MFSHVVDSTYTLCPTVHTNRWFDQDVKTSLDLADDMPLTQRRLVETIITLPGGGDLPAQRSHQCGRCPLQILGAGCRGSGQNKGGEIEGASAR
jgi:hypothetical protein